MAGERADQLRVTLGMDIEEGYWHKVVRCGLFVEKAWGLESEISKTGVPGGGSKDKGNLIHARHLYPVTNIVQKGMNYLCLESTAEFATSQEQRTSSL